jgi:hypothetical protein
MRSDNDRQWVSRVLGEAVIDVWSGLPQDVQQKLFEQAVLAGQSGSEEELRQRLARFLHDHHQRTAGHEGAAAVPGA